MDLDELTAQRKSPDWKQWIPIYGFYQIVKDRDEGKPSLSRDSLNHPLRHSGSAIYHGVVTGLTIGGLYLGLVKLLQ